MMNEKELAKFRTTLETAQQKIIESQKISEAASDTVELDQGAFGRVSRMDAMQSQAMASELRRRNTLSLQKIGAALQRIESGTYGRCTRCNGNIELGRLEFDPSAALCVACARKGG